MNNNATQILERFTEICMRHTGCELKHATKQQLYRVVCQVVRDLLAEKRRTFERNINAQGAKQVYYLSMEFLVGTSLHNNLYHLQLEDVFAETLQALGTDVTLADLYEMEPDAGLGNGGLGRLASCYMDAMSTMAYPITGYSLRYEFGIFRQKIVDGWQMELPDDWLDLGDVWLIPRKEDAVEVHFGGKLEEFYEDGGIKIIHHDYTPVLAVPYDLLISGYQSDAVNKLVLWSAKSKTNMDMQAFSRGDYVKAVEENAMAEAISKVLYPADDHMEGKILRVKQQYLFVSASLQTIVRQHLQAGGTLASLPDKAAIHINDTHPSLCVPELMRILLDDHRLPWDEAWEICGRTLAYTNHTVMSEALERWPEQIFREYLPRIYQLITEINRRQLNLLRQQYPGDVAKHDYMAILANGEIRMANLCLACCHTINGVSKLHTDIVTQSIFRDFYHLNPEKFQNVTNGIAYRRWLCQANPALTAFLQELIGPRFLEDATALEELMQLHDDQAVLSRLDEIKRQNKQRLCGYIAEHNGINVDPDSIFDVQIKRLHEYKRQLLNVLHILHLYRQIKAQAINLETLAPRTFIFGAKAPPGYRMAKQIIRLIDTTARLVNADPIVREKVKLIFLEDYKVSLAELIIPAADISEQISIAGKEASGTGNMKLMINGAVTLGTLDGANVEIHEQVGDDNIFLFGLTTPEVEALWQAGYDPLTYFHRSQDLNAVVSMLISGELGATFEEIYHGLLTGQYGVADPYMTLVDFDDYRLAQERISAVYGGPDRRQFLKMSLVNIAKAGIFSSDRAAREYADRIWQVKPVR